MRLKTLRQRDVPGYHRVRIARSTLKMPDAMARIMGGPTKAEAREILRRYGFKRNPILSVRRPQPGMRVRVVHGSGVDSGKAGVIVGWNQVKTDGRGTPTNIQGEYWTLSESKKRGMLPVRLDNGELILMFRNRLTQIGANPRQYGFKRNPVKPSQIKTKRDGNFVMLQLRGTTLQGLWRESSRGTTNYKSDTFGRRYKTVREAKEHAAKLASEGYFGPALSSNPKGGLALRIKPTRVVVRRVDGEWAVYGYAGKRRVAEYFTDDKRDAQGTAVAMRARAGIGKNPYELFYGSGGHGGPYSSAREASKAARRLLRGSRSERSIEVRERSATGMGGYGRTIARFTKKNPKGRSVFQAIAVRGRVRRTKYAGYRRNPG